MKQKGSILYSSATALAGLLTMLLIYMGQEKALNAYETNLPYINLGEKVQNEVLTAHLRLEEYLSGDESLNYEKDIVGLMNTAVVQLEEAKTTISRQQDEELQQLAKIIERNIGEIEHLITVSHSRNNNTSGQNHEAGSALDQQFDQAFEKVNATLRELNAFTQKRVEQELSFMESMRYISLSLIFLIFAALSAAIFLIQRKNEKKEEEDQQKLAHELNRIDKLTQFVQGIAKGNHEQELDLNGENDELALALLRMRVELQESQQNEEKRSWATQGLAQLGTLLHSSRYEGEELYDQLIRFFVKYTGSIQGGLYILEKSKDKEKEQLKMVACFAYDRKKHMEQRLYIGEGLAGQCVLEQQSIYITDIPQDYVTITSGLGEATPSSLLIVPLKVNEQVQGVIELTSFNEYEEHQIEFVEKGGENLASAISSLKITERTKELLRASDEHSEQMIAQEMEMRQNMEELIATQEELSRKEKEYLQRIKELEEQVKN
jgi:putative methionine-R-sulfoxide reductase with GAF domain